MQGMASTCCSKVHLRAQLHACEPGTPLAGGIARLAPHASTARWHGQGRQRSPVQALHRIAGAAVASGVHETTDKQVDLHMGRVLAGVDQINSGIGDVAHPQAWRLREFLKHC